MTTSRRQPSAAARRMPLIYRIVLGLVAPFVRRWGRLRVTGADLIAGDRPVLLVGNHDSYWDSVVIGIAALRTRQIRAVAKSSLWRYRPVAAVLDGMGQLPVTRGRADRAELAVIVAALAGRDCVGIFPEGRISKGRTLRAYSGAGWLARTVPSARIVCVAVTGTVDLARFPRSRPHICVEFFEPVGGQRGERESSIGMSRRVLAEIREHAPPTSSGVRAIV